jgi:hypothetical protein
MVVISTGKVLVPGIDNLLQMVFNQFLSFRHNVPGEARLTGQFNYRLQPKLGLPIRVRHMNMDRRLAGRRSSAGQWLWKCH